MEPIYLNGYKNGQKIKLQFVPINSQAWRIYMLEDRRVKRKTITGWERWRPSLGWEFKTLKEATDFVETAGWELTVEEKEQ